MQSQLAAGSSVYSYNAIRLLQQDGEMEIYLVEQVQTHKQFQMKIIPRQEQDEIKFNLEINALQQLKGLNNDNIVKFEEVIKSNSKYFIVTEYCENGTLETFVNKTFNDFEIIEYFKQLLNGFRALNQLHIIHQELQPSNILITKDNILKISNFGSDLTSNLIIQQKQISNSISNHFSVQLFKKSVELHGMPCFVAPEIVDQNIQTFTSRMNIWSLGVLLYFMKFKNYPFFLGDLLKLSKEIQKNFQFGIQQDPNTKQFDYVSGIQKLEKFLDTKVSSDQCSNQIAELIKSMLVLDPKERISWTNLLNFENKGLEAVDNEVLVEQNFNYMNSNFLQNPNLQIVNQNRENLILQKSDQINKILVSKLDESQDYHKPLQESKIIDSKLNQIFGNNFEEPQNQPKPGLPMISEIQEIQSTSQYLQQLKKSGIQNKFTDIREEETVQQIDQQTPLSYSQKQFATLQSNENAKLFLNKFKTQMINLQFLPYTVIQHINLGRQYGFKINWSTIIILMKATVLLINEFMFNVFENKQNVLKDSDFQINLLLNEKSLRDDWKQFQEKSEDQYNYYMEKIENHKLLNQSDLQKLSQIKSFKEMQEKYETILIKNIKSLLAFINNLESEEEKQKKDILALVVLEHKAKDIKSILDRLNEELDIIQIEKKVFSQDIAITLFELKEYNE